MTGSVSIVLPIGQDGLRVETEQDPDSSDPKALSNVSNGTLKHSVNMDYQSGVNVRRRKGYHVAFNGPDDGTRVVHQIWDSLGVVVTDRLWQHVMDSANGIKSLGRYTYMDNRQVKAENGYDLQRYTIFSTRDETERYITLFLNSLTTVPDTSSVITHSVSGDTGVVLAADTTDNWIFIYDTTVGGGTWAAGNITDGAGPMAPDPAVISSTTSTAISHTIHWRNPGVPFIRQLEYAPLDRSTGLFDIVDATGNFCFSDTSITGSQPARFRNYETWGRGGERETFLLDTYGGHLAAPAFAATPRPWNCGAAGNQPPAGSFDQPYVSPFAVQRRVQIWFPEWYAWWAALNGYPTGGGHEIIGLNYQYAPFIFYLNHYDDSRNLVLTLEALTAAPTAGATITGADSGATMLVTSSDTTNNTITGQHTSVGTEFELGENLTDGGGGTLAPDPAVLASFEHFDYDDFYAEPCGRFIEKFKDSLFMARIERSFLEGHGFQTAGTVGWTYEPSAYMWSHYGLATGMEIVPSGSSVPVYPMEVPGEPRERVWGCFAQGYQLNRHNLFRPADSMPIVGLKTWAENLYIMKPSGFGEISGSYSGNFRLRDLEMSQGPAGAFAWAKADEGIYYVTKKGLYLFDGNRSSENFCMSDGRTKKIFADDVDWGNATDMLTGEIVGASVVWNKTNRQILISYPKIGEQGVGTGEGGNDLPAGTPTRMLVFDTLGKRFSEYIYPLSIDTGYRSPCPGIMASGTDPTDDDYLMLTHPIGNFIGANSNGRFLYRGNQGHRDNVELDASGDPEPVSGQRIIFNVTTKDYTFDSLDSKLAINQDKVVAYTNGGNIKRRHTFDFYDAIEEAVDLEYPVAGADGYIQTVPFKHKTRATQSASGASGWTTVAFSYYHDEFIHDALSLEFASITNAPTVGSTLTQLNTGATILVTSTSGNFVRGQDQETGTWDVVGANTVSGGGFAPVAAPIVLATVVNPDNTNPDNPIEFVGHSVTVQGKEGYVK